MRFFISLLCCLLMTTAFADISYDDDDGDGPGYTKDKSKIYRLYNDVMLRTKKDVKYDKPKIVIRLVYPELYTTESDDNVSALHFNDLVQGIIATETKNYIDKVHGFNNTQANQASKPAGANNLYIDYSASSFTANKNHLISIRFTIQGVIAGMARPYHYHRVINFDLSNDRELTWTDLFREDDDYLQVLARYTYQRLYHRLNDKALLASGVAPRFENYQVWNLKPNGLLITFEEATVAPSVYGAQMILIPYPELKRISTQDSPIKACITHKLRCQQSSILTGGFIDEAMNMRHFFFNPLFS